MRRYSGGVREARRILMVCGNRFLIPRDFSIVRREAEREDAFLAGGEFVLGVTALVSFPEREQYRRAVGLAV